MLALTNNELESARNMSFNQSSSKMEEVEVDKEIFFEVTASSEEDDEVNKLEVE